MNVPILTTRKVHNYGEGGLAVLIPAEWARQHDIAKGSEVLVLANDQVVIKPCSEEEVEKLRTKIEETISGGRDKDE